MSTRLAVPSSPQSHRSLEASIATHCPQRPLLLPASGLLAVLSLAAIFSLQPQAAQAADASWAVNADGAWAVDANWNPAAAPGSTVLTNSADIAFFNNVISAGRAITVDSNRNIFGIDFTGNSSAYTLAGGSLILSNGGFIQTNFGGSTHTDSVNSPITLIGNAYFNTNATSTGRILSIGGTVTGSAATGNTITLALTGIGTSANNNVTGLISDGANGGKLSLTKAGAGTWSLTNGGNSYSGGTLVDGGKLTLASNVSFGTGGIGTGGIVFQNGGILGAAYSTANTLIFNNAMSVANGHSGTIETPVRFRMNGAVTGAGTLNLAITTTVSRADLQNDFTGFSGALNFTGSGTVRLGISSLGTSQPLFPAAGFGGTTLGVDGATIQPVVAAGGATISIGALTSTGATGVLGGGATNTGAASGMATYSIGSKNVASTTFQGAIVGNSALTKIGTGILTMAGVNTYTGTTIVNGGTLGVSGGTLGTVGADIQIATATGLSGILNVSGGTVNAARVIAGGNSANNVAGNPNGSVTQSAGTINSAQWFSLGSGSAAATTSASGIFTQTGGILNVNSAGGAQMEVGNFAGTSGLVNMSGSTSAINILNSGNIALGANNAAASGIFNQNGGTVTFYSDAAGTMVGGTGSLKIGAAATSAGTFEYTLGNGPGSNALLVVPSITHTSGTGNFNFNGGTLKATASTGTFLGGLTAANVRAGGAIINDGGFSVTISQPLLHAPELPDADGGLKKLGGGELLLAAVNSFTGPTVVSAGTLNASIAGSLRDTAVVAVNNGGTLLLSGSAGDRINDNAGVFLGETSSGTSGRFNTGGLSETVGALTLDISSTIDFGVGASTLVFGLAGAPASTFANGTILTISNWSGNPSGNGTDRLIFGSDMSAYLGQVKFDNFTLGASQIPVGANQFEIVPVPEPTTLISMLSLLGLVAFRGRRFGRSPRCAV